MNEPSRPSASTASTASTASIEAAWSAYESGNLLEAVDLCDALLTSDPGDREVRSLRACALLDLDMPTAAERDIEAIGDDQVHDIDLGARIAYLRARLHDPACREALGRVEELGATPLFLQRTALAVTCLTGYRPEHDPARELLILDPADEAARAIYLAGQVDGTRRSPRHPWQLDVGSLWETRLFQPVAEADVAAELVRRAGRLLLWTALLCLATLITRQPYAAAIALWVLLGVGIRRARADRAGHSLDLAVLRRRALARPAIRACRVALGLGWLALLVVSVGTLPDHPLTAVALLAAATGCRLWAGSVRRDRVRAAAYTPTILPPTRHGPPRAVPPVTVRPGTVTPGALATAHPAGD